MPFCLTRRAETTNRDHPAAGPSRLISDLTLAATLCLTLAAFWPHPDAQAGERPPAARHAVAATAPDTAFTAPVPRGALFDSTDPVAELRAFSNTRATGSWMKRGGIRLAANSDGTIGKGRLLILPGETVIRFDEPLTTGPAPINGKSIKELVKGQPLFSPIEGLNDKVWKDKHCYDCHKWDKVTLCDQGGVYARNEPDHMLRKQHPYGGAFKLALRNWSLSGCN